MEVLPELIFLQLNIYKMLGMSDLAQRGNQIFQLTTVVTERTYWFSSYVTNRVIFF